MTTRDEIGIKSDRGMPYSQPYALDTCSWTNLGSGGRTWRRVGDNDRKSNQSMDAGKRKGKNGRSITDIAWTGEWMTLMMR